MVMFSIIQLGFTRFLTDRKKWIYLPPLRYMCVWWRRAVPDIGGSAPGFWLPFWILPCKKCNAPTPHMPIGPATWVRNRPDWVHEWVQRSGLIPICPDNQALLRREVVGLLTPRLYIRGVHALPFDRQLGLGVLLNLGAVPKLSQSGQGYAAVGIAIAGGVKGLQLDAVTRTCEDSRVTL